jgi:hypothetical protein
MEIRRFLQVQVNLSLKLAKRHSMASRDRLRRAHGVAEKILMECGGIGFF